MAVFMGPTLHLFSVMRAYLSEPSSIARDVVEVSGGIAECAGSSLGLPPPTQHALLAYLQPLPEIAGNEPEYLGGSLKAILG